MGGYICIYSGRGTSKECVRATEETFAKLLGADGKSRIITIEHPNDFSDRCLMNGNTLVIPGGYTPKMKEHLSQQGDIGKVLNFIREKKGFYIGICAGTYLASQIGLSSTEMHWMATSDFETKVPQKIVKIFDVKTSQAMSALWWMGGAFENPANSEKVVAYYQPEQARKIAVLKPQSNIFLSNVHFEFQVSEKMWTLGLAEDDAWELVYDVEKITKWVTDQLSFINQEPARQSPFKEKSPLVDSSRTRNTHSMKFMVNERVLELPCLQVQDVGETPAPTSPLDLNQIADPIQRVALIALQEHASRIYIGIFLPLETNKFSWMPIEPDQEEPAQPTFMSRIRSATKGCFDKISCLASDLIESAALPKRVEQVKEGFSNIRDKAPKYLSGMRDMLG